MLSLASPFSEHSPHVGDRSITCSWLEQLILLTFDNAAALAGHPTSFIQSINHGLARFWEHRCCCEICQCSTTHVCFLEQLLTSLNLEHWQPALPARRRKAGITLINICTMLLQGVPWKQQWTHADSKHPDVRGSPRLPFLSVCRIVLPAPMLCASLSPLQVWVISSMLAALGWGWWPLQLPLWWLWAGTGYSYNWQGLCGYTSMGPEADSNGGTIWCKTREQHPAGGTRMVV